MKILFFPYAGASSATFMKWKNFFYGFTLIPVDPPGRGSRLLEPLCKTIGEMASDIKEQVLRLVENGEEYTLFGHSMGALLIYELLHKLQEIDFTMPVHVFISGKNPPHILNETPIIEYTDAEFIEKILELGGVEPVFFQNPLLAKMFLPILRADVGAADNYCYAKKKEQLPVDISFFFASDDSMVNEKFVKLWADYITGSFQMYYFTGGHFFIFERIEIISNIMKETLSNIDGNIPY